MTFAAYYGRTNMVFALLKAGVNPNAVDGRDYFPLMSAADGALDGLRRPGHDNAYIAKLLLANGANVNQVTRHGTALHKAVLRAKVDFVSLLLEKGADPSLKDHHGFSPAAFLDRIRDPEKRRRIIQDFRRHAARGTSKTQRVEPPEPPPPSMETRQEKPGWKALLQNPLQRFKRSPPPK
jgi:ankyrin repeat protein